MTGMELNTKFGSTVANGDGGKTALGNFLGASLNEMFAAPHEKQAARDNLMKAAIQFAPDRAGNVHAYDAKHPVVAPKAAEVKPAAAATAKTKMGSGI